MSKLGYTWYPKDFISDPDVMFMSAAERGVYRDLIDLAYTNKNRIKYSVEKLARYCNSDVETMQKVLDSKCEKIDDYWTVPSCQKRIDLAERNKENGKKGGAPTGNENAKTTQKQPKNNPKTTQKTRQREREREIKKERENNNTPLNPPVGGGVDLVQSAFDDFLSMRKKIKKPATPRAVELLKKKLEELSAGNEEKKIEIINQSTLNCWQDLYPLREEKEKISAKKENNRGVTAAINAFSNTKMYD